MRRLTPAQRNRLKQALLQKRRELQDRMDRPVRPADVGDEVDEATEARSQELQLEASGVARQTLVEIEDALRKIAEGVYGLCERCQKPIPFARLKAVPHARYCLDCQDRYEQALSQGPPPT